jgi:hypothetical protein
MTGHDHKVFRWQNEAKLCNLFNKLNVSASSKPALGEANLGDAPCRDGGLPR